jgi:hypothetical protein
MNELQRDILQCIGDTSYWHCATSCPRTAPHPAEAGKRAEQRQRHAGDAVRILDDRTIPRETSVRLRRFDHGQRHSVFHAARGFLVGPIVFSAQRCRAAARNFSLSFRISRTSA